MCPSRKGVGEARREKGKENAGECREEAKREEKKAGGGRERKGRGKREKEADTLPMFFNASL